MQVLKAMGRWKSDAYKYARKMQIWRQIVFRRKNREEKLRSLFPPFSFPPENDVISGFHQRIFLNHSVNRAHYVTIPQGNIAALAARWVPEAGEEAAAWAEVEAANRTAQTSIPLGMNQ